MDVVTIQRHTIECLGRVAFFLALLASALPGCKAPIFHLAVDRPAASVFAVRIDDQRPTWERKFYQGGIDNRVFQNDATFIPVERIDPSPWEMMRHQLQTRFSHCGIQPQQIDVRVRSCRIVENYNLDAVEIADARRNQFERDAARHAKHEADRQHDRQRGLPVTDDDCSDEIAGEIGWAMMKGLGRVTLEGARQVGHWTHVLPGKAGPPSQIDLRNYPRGVTFELEGEAIVTLATGEQKTTPIRYGETVPSRKGAADSLKLAVHNGVSDTADRIVRQTLNLPPPESAIAPHESSATGDTPILPLVTHHIAPAPPQVVTDEIKRLEQAEAQRSARVADGVKLR